MCVRYGKGKIDLQSQHCLMTGIMDFLLSVVFLHFRLITNGLNRFCVELSLIAAVLS